MTEEKKLATVVHVRVTANGTIAEAVATQIGELMEAHGYELLEQSPAYPTRYGPDEMRVFLILR